MKFDALFQYISILGRVVEAIDLRPIGRSPCGFEPRRMQFYSFPQTDVNQGYIGVVMLNEKIITKEFSIFISITT